MPKAICLCGKEIECETASEILKTFQEMIVNKHDLIPGKYEVRVLIDLEALAKDVEEFQQRVAHKYSY